jgi:hypothetical protein
MMAGMMTLILIGLLRGIRTHRALVLENLALRHQLAVLQRSAPRLRLRRSDRRCWVLLSRLWNRWMDAVSIVQPATVIRWQRTGFKFSRSPSDVAPVFDVIVAHACRLCEGVFANVVRFDGELMHNMAQHGFNPQAQEALARLFPARLTRASMSGRAILNGTVVYTEDVRGESRVGQGSTFSFTLPVGSASDQGGGEPPRP